MRATVNTRLTLAGAAIAAAAALVSCGNTTGGTAVCPGCGTVAEPSFPTPPPSISTSTPAPGPGGTAAPGPGETLPSNEQGYVYVETKSGKTRCELNSESVGCESQFENSPVVNGEPANGVSVTAGGTVRWVVGNLGDIPTVTLDYGTYSAAGWTIAADANGTRFTNDATGHGMLVAVEGVQAF
ncbi:MAG TPA: hypothetical protein VIU87_02020 [Mycobacterium sp.]